MALRSGVSLCEFEIVCGCVVYKIKGQVGVGTLFKSKYAVQFVIVEILFDRLPGPCGHSIIVVYPVHISSPLSTRFRRHFGHGF